MLGFDIQEALNSAFITAQRSMLKELLEEIEAYDYNTVSQIKGSIYLHLEDLQRLEEE